MLIAATLALPLLGAQPLQSPVPAYDLRAPLTLRTTVPEAALRRPLPGSGGDAGEERGIAWTISGGLVGLPLGIALGWGVVQALIGPPESVPVTAMILGGLAGTAGGVLVGMKADEGYSVPKQAIVTVSVLELGYIGWLLMNPPDGN